MLSLQVDEDPSSHLGTEFKALEAAEKRDTTTTKNNMERPQMTKYFQDHQVHQTTGV